jgi:hypothetical protein
LTVRFNTALRAVFFGSIFPKLSIALDKEKVLKVGVKVDDMTKGKDFDISVSSGTEIISTV